MRDGDPETVIRGWRGSRASALALAAVLAGCATAVPVVDPARLAVLERRLERELAFGFADGAGLLRVDARTRTVEIREGDLERALEILALERMREQGGVAFAPSESRSLAAARTRLAREADRLTTLVAAGYRVVVVPDGSGKTGETLLTCVSARNPQLRLDCRGRGLRPGAGEPVSPAEVLDLLVRGGMDEPPGTRPEEDDGDARRRVAAVDEPEGTGDRRPPDAEVGGEPEDTPPDDPSPDPEADESDGPTTGIAAGDGGIDPETVSSESGDGPVDPELVSTGRDAGRGPVDPEMASAGGGAGRVDPELASSGRAGGDGRDVDPEMTSAGGDGRGIDPEMAPAGNGRPTAPADWRVIAAAETPGRRGDPEMEAGSFRRIDPAGAGEFRRVGAAPGTGSEIGSEKPGRGGGGFVEIPPAQGDEGGRRVDPELASAGRAGGGVDPEMASSRGVGRGVGRETGSNRGGAGRVDPELASSGRAGGDGRDVDPEMTSAGGDGRGIDPEMAPAGNGRPTAPADWRVIAAAETPGRRGDPEMEAGAPLWARLAALGRARLEERRTLSRIREALAEYRELAGRGDRGPEEERRLRHLAAFLGSDEVRGLLGPLVIDPDLRRSPEIPYADEGGGSDEADTEE